MSLKTNNLPSNKEEVLEEGFLDGLARLAVRAGARRLGGRAARQAIRSAPTATSLFSGGGFIGSLASFIISTASSIYFGLMRMPGGSVVLAMSSDIYKAYTGYNFRENPYIFDGSAEKAKDLIKNVQIAYKRYLTAYLNEIRSFDPNDGTNLLNTLLALGTGGLSQLVTGGDPVGYLTSVVTETGWGKTVSKKIMERREERANELNDKLIKFNPKNYINSSQYPVEEFKRDLLSDLRSMISTEYIRSSKTGVNQLHDGQEEAIQAITPLLDSLVEANLQLWYGLTNRTENGETTETTELAPKKSSAKVNPKRQEAAKAAAAATATAISKRTANNKNALKQKLEQVLPQEEKNNISLWYNWLSSFVDTQAEINMLDDVLEKWFSSERVKKLEERKFVLPGGNSYEDLMDFIEKNTSYSIGDPKKDLVVLDRLLDLISSERKMKKRAKQAARRLRKAKELEDKSAEAEEAGKQKKSDRLKKRAIKKKEKAKMKLTESELNRIILQEVRKLLEQERDPLNLDTYIFALNNSINQNIRKLIVADMADILAKMKKESRFDLRQNFVMGLDRNDANVIQDRYSDKEINFMAGVMTQAIMNFAKFLLGRGGTSRTTFDQKMKDLFADNALISATGLTSRISRALVTLNYTFSSGGIAERLGFSLPQDTERFQVMDPDKRPQITGAPKTSQQPRSTVDLSGIPADWRGFASNSTKHAEMARAWLAATGGGNLKEAVLPKDSSYKAFQDWYKATAAELKRQFGPSEAIELIRRSKKQFTGTLPSATQSSNLSTGQAASPAAATGGSAVAMTSAAPAIDKAVQDLRNIEKSLKAKEGPTRTVTYDFSEVDGFLPGGIADFGKVTFAKGPLGNRKRAISMIAKMITMLTLLKNVIAQGEDADVQQNEKIRMTAEEIRIASEKIDSGL